MLYKLIDQKEIKEKNVTTKITRLYRNDNGSETKTESIYKDRDGRFWFGFVDLFKVPVIRTAMSQYITNLYNVGLSVRDILAWCDQEKKLCKSTDPDKLEKIYALALEKERVATFTADPIKQTLAVATVYILTDEERVDYFSPEESEAKLRLWGGMPEAVGFFLRWLNDHTDRYMKPLKTASQIVSKLQKLGKTN